ncbi:MAG: protein kinase [Sideroxydans sp.]|nr:protein kinase [Sideroxydans sp.]
MPTTDKLGKYELRRELGKGAMGIVYEGFDPFIQRTVAVKTIQKSLVEPSEMEEAFARFRREAQAAGRLSHPKIISIYDYGEEGDLAYIAMEYVDGSELKDLLDAGDILPIADSLRIMLQVLDALEYSHQRGVIHRDIKPANIMIAANGSIKIADFGIAKMDSSHLTQAGMVLGTPTYMSPEQFMGKEVDGRSDLYSAGVTLYQMLTGERPFTGSPITIMNKVMHQLPTPPSHFNPKISPALDLVVMKSLAKTPEERFQNAAEFMRALKRTIPQDAPTPALSDTTLVISTDNLAAMGTPVDDFAVRQRDIKLWREISDSTQRSDFERYLQEFPKGEFLDLAKRRLANLDKLEQEALQEQERKRQALLAAAERQQQLHKAQLAAEAAQMAKLEAAARARVAAEARQKEELARKAKLAQHLARIKDAGKNERMAAAEAQAKLAATQAVRQQQLADLQNKRAQEFADVMAKRTAEAQAKEALGKPTRRKLRQRNKQSDES